MDPRSKIVSIIQCLLYELQPFRIQDVVALFTYILKSSKELGGAGLVASELAYQHSFDAVAVLSWKQWLGLGLWFVFWAVFIHAEFGSLWIIISMIASIFLNLGKKKKGEISAYSVFNDGFKQLLGTLTADQFDDEIRHNSHNPRKKNNLRDIVQLDDIVGDEQVDDWLDEPLRHINQNHHRRMINQDDDKNENENEQTRIGKNRKGSVNKKGGGARKKSKKSKKHNFDNKTHAIVDQLQFEDENQQKQQHQQVQQKQLQRAQYKEDEKQAQEEDGDDDEEDDDDGDEKNNISY